MGRTEQDRTGQDSSQEVKKIRREMYGKNYIRRKKKALVVSACSIT